MYIPMNYDHIKNRNNRSFDYYVRTLFQRATTVFEWELPENWDGNVKDFFLYCLFRDGYLDVDRQYEGVMFWQNIDDPSAIDVTPAVPDFAGTGEQTAGTNVSLADEDALMTDFQLESCHNSTGGKKALQKQLAAHLQECD